MHVQAYLAEFLPFNFFSTTHWETKENKFSYEHVKEHRDFILLNDTISCLWFLLTRRFIQSYGVFYFCHALGLNRLKPEKENDCPFLIEKQFAIS